MDRIIEPLISGDLNTTSLLLLFIIGILTKRFVPWWVHEAALEKLKQYEESAPQLVDELGTLIDLLGDPDVANVVHEKTQGRRSTKSSEELRRVVRRHERRITRAGKGR